MPHPTRFDTGTQSREDSPGAIYDLGGFMSPKARTDAVQRDIQVHEPAGEVRLETITEAELEIIRQRLAEGFYDRREIRDTVVEAVRRELDGTHPAP
jgi:hypothetical protein